MHVAIASAIWVAALMGGCNGADFGGSNAVPKSAENGCDPAKPGCDNASSENSSPSSETPPSTNCVDGDKLKLEWTGDVKECLIDKGQTYNFRLKKCTEMRPAKFDCDWDTVRKELSDRNLLTPVLKSDSENGAKLVTCGQSEDGNRIVVQWVSLPEGKAIDCKQAATGATITSACYTVYKAGETRPPAPANEAEKAEQVYECMNRL